MRKPRAQLVEIFNDIDQELVNVFRVLRDDENAKILKNKLLNTPYSRFEFEQSYQAITDPIEQARRTICRAFMGFGSDSASGAKTGFRANGNRQSAHPAKDWANYPRNIDSFTERLAGVVIECRPALEIIAQHDATTTLHYCDPPYVQSSRSPAVFRNGKGYRHEMLDHDHEELAMALRQAKGMVMISGYANPMYDEELYKDWHRFERNALADGALDRVEVIWLNEACAIALDQQKIQQRMFA